MKAADILNIPKLLKNDKAVKILVVIGFFLIILIFLADLFGGESKDGKTPDINNDTVAYIDTLEQRLCDIVAEIEGAGRVKIMLTLENLDENVYSERETAVKTTKTPVVRGVAVICEGGGDLVIKEKIVETVSKVLGISSARVCVTH